MNRSIIILLFYFVIFSTYASIIEPKEPGVLEVTYLKETNLDTLNREKKSLTTDKIKLRIGNTSSMFYPPKRLWSDSLQTYNSEMYEQLLKAANPPGQKSYVSLGGSENEFVFRNVREGSTLVYTTSGGGMYYTEPTELPVWTIETETKEVLGYECIKATCNYRGRSWTAWFAPELPYKEGPWKLAGLPGLVLEAYDTHKDYRFTALDLNNTNIPSVGIYIYCNGRPFVYKSRAKLLTLLWKDYLQGSFVARMRSMYGGSGKASKPHKSNYDFLETDYPHE